MTHRSAKNYVSAIEQGLMALLAAVPDAKQKSYLALWLARFYNRNFVPIFIGDRIEECIGQQVFTECALVAADCEPGIEYLILATSLYKDGGHSRMVEATVDSFAECKDLALTKVATSDAAVVAAVKKKIALSLFDESADPVGKIVAIYRKLLQYRKVILYTNPEDIESAVAIWIDKKLNPGARKYFFVNHADHLFSYARGLSDAILEVSEYGWSLNARLGLSGKQSFLGIPIRAAEVNDKQVDVKNSSSKIILSGGAAYKFKNIDGNTLWPYIDSVLVNNRDCKFYLVGPSYTTALWVLWLKLKYRGRFFCFKTMHYAEYKNLLKSVAVYVDSFPLTGGTAFTEALLSGLNVLGVEGGFSGYGYADNLRVNTVAAFNQEIEDLLAAKADAIKRQQRVRGQAFQFHSLTAFAARLKGIASDDVKMGLERFTDEGGAKSLGVSLGGRSFYRCPALDGLGFAVIFRLFMFGLKSKFGILFALEFVARFIVRLRHDAAHP